MQHSLEEFKRFVCENLTKAIAAYTYDAYSDNRYWDVIYTLERLGLTRQEANNIYSVLEKFKNLRHYMEAETAIVKCLDKLDIINESKKRIEMLGNDEKRVLQIASLCIKKIAEILPFRSDWFYPSELAKIVSTMLLKDVDSEYIKKLFIKTLLAVKRKDYMKLIPNTIEVVNELARAVEDEWPDYNYVYSKLKHIEFHQIAALVKPEEHFYEAVYGYKVEDILASTSIEKIVYKGVINELIVDEIRKAVSSLAQEHCHSIMSSYLADALQSIGYEVNLEYKGFLEHKYCCRYAALRPGSTIYVYICPFAVALPLVGADEKAVIVVRGVCARLPEYIGLLKKGSKHTRLIDALWLCVHKDKIYAFAAALKEGWQKEIVKALKEKYGNVNIVGAITEHEPTILPPTIPSITATREPSIPMPSETIRAREDLERIVALALKALGFQVWTNVRKIARKGASVEVDVWAEKRVGDTRFKAYVSCKNWNRDVDRSVVDEEFGRVFNLQEVPHLRILVVKSMSKPAKEVAEADGFFVIEVGEKAARANANEIYKLIYKKLSDIFTSIAPPQLLGIAKKVSETAKELNKIAQELAKLSQNYQAP